MFTKNDAAVAFWRAAKVLNSEYAALSAVEAAIQTLTDLAIYFQKTHPTVAARAAATLEARGLLEMAA